MAADLNLRVDQILGRPTPSNGGTQSPNNGTTVTNQTPTNGTAAQTGENVVAPAQPKVQSNDATATTTTTTQPATTTTTSTGLQPTTNATNSNLNLDAGKVYADATKVTPEQRRDIIMNSRPWDDPNRKVGGYERIFLETNPYRPPTKEELEAERKRQKRNAIIAALGDGISSMANIYYVGRGALNTNTGKNNMSDALKAQWDKNKKDRETKSKEFYQAYVEAVKRDKDEALAADERAYQRGQDKIKNDREDEKFQFTKDEANRAQANWDKQFEADQKWKAKSFAEGVRQFNINSQQQARRLNMEATRLQRELDNGSVTFTLGTGNGNVRISKDKLNAQTVSYVFSQLPEDVRNTVQGKEITTSNEYGIKQVVGHEQPSTEAMLIAIGMNAENPKVGAALKDIEKGVEDMTAPYMR